MGIDGIAQNIDKMVMYKEEGFQWNFTRQQNEMIRRITYQMDGEIELKTYFLGRKADMVEVVRCKNCKHMKSLLCLDGSSVIGCERWGMRGDDWYCADGEPKGGDGDATV